jgi:hypothetical protein
MNEIENDHIPNTPEPPPGQLEILLSCTRCGLQFRKILALDAVTELRCSHCEQLLSTVVPMVGLVYVLSNPSMPGIVKIGRTNRKIEERLRELSISTGIPQPFVREALFSSADTVKDEQNIHNRLSAARVSYNREFFSLSPQEAVDAIKNILGRHPFEGPCNGAEKFTDLWQPKAVSVLSRY